MSRRLAGRRSSIGPEGYSRSLEDASATAETSSERREVPCRDSSPGRHTRADEAALRASRLALAEVDQPAALADPPLAVERRLVLVADQLEGGGPTALGDHHRPGEEDLPKAEPALAVALD